MVPCTLELFVIDSGLSLLRILEHGDLRARTRRNFACAPEADDRDDHPAHRERPHKRRSGEQRRARETQERDHNEREAQYSICPILPHIVVLICD